eukprot:CAMPEP_0174739792 /NCGR_PEP_ID=MMETSP1094-20130205/72188_1 /TAXON_ID=156173 /ORGANISM="Chrysochromulina brevifilum, Strain UTEX LB 985" /LENGTH=262 /DNA_ID=CAMNT_0015943391 /DNA_START=1 /DNA_END=789 /DNA_ORIENTATION=-
MAAVDVQDEALPDLLATRLAVLKEKPGPPVITLAHMAMRDEHVPKLVEALHHSECAATSVDLVFNELTGNGLLALCDALCSDGMMAHDLQFLYFGGNDASDEVRAKAVERLRKQRQDVTLDFEPRMRIMTPLMDVGKVFPDSPASQAGMVKYDVILALGALSIAGKKPNRAFKSDAERHLDEIQHFAGIEETLKPLVDAAVRADGTNKHAISVVVERAGVGHLKLVLRPGKWSGPGLLGAKITAVEASLAKPKDRKSPLDVG